MNTVRKSILVGLTAFGMAGAAVGVQAQQAQQEQGTAPAAQGPSGHGHKMSPQERAAKFAERQAKRAERRAERQAKLHEALKLTPAQEPAWNAFVAATQAGEAKARHQHGAFKEMSAPQRLEARIAMQKARTERMEQRLAALNSFYAVLTPEQRKVFDERSMRHGGKHRWHKRGQHGMQG